SWAPAAGAGPAYPKLSFIGSDDPIGDGSGGSNLGKFNCVNAGTWTGTTASPACTTAVMTTAKGWGSAIQFPALNGAVAPGYQPAAGTWTEHGQAILGNTVSHLSLTTNTWCGIFTGAITDWNDPAITGDSALNTGNRGVSLTGGLSQPISVTFRKDGSGTTFI